MVSLQAISDLSAVRKTLGLFFTAGDSIRPIVQKPIISQLIGTETIGRALDAGCGRGLYTRVLLEYAQKVDALDYSPRNIDCLRRRLGRNPKLSLCTGSADVLPFAAEQFDLVLHCEVLEHIENDAQVVSELFRVLKPGGRLIISVPVPPAPIEDHEHVREGYTLEQLTALLQVAGFGILQHRYCLYKLSKQMIKFENWWIRNVRLPMPTVLLLPLFKERLFSGPSSADDLPYDVCVEAFRPWA